MADIIKLLPESVANQIAAGEVVQRPASVVKELLENAVDAGATTIELALKDAGKTLIQVIDNGKGMSVADARMAFERHATSKINRAEDLFAIQSFGFRGEALASIASVARVELKTRTADSEAGIAIVIEGSKFISQEMCATAQGTNLLVKDLFYNIPARRQFLKSDSVETRHIWDEFHHLVLPNYQIRFRFFENGKPLMSLEPSNLLQRIVGVFGKSYQQKLIALEQKTQDVSVTGLIIKPEYAKKTRGEQFIFVNNRFIRSPYINSAIRNAYSGLISDDSFPGHFIFLSIDPAQIDINIHPTKTEIKFRDERLIASVIASTVRRALGSHNAMPAIDFEVEQNFDLTLDPTREVKIPQIKINPDYNPFKNSVQPIDYTSTERSRLRWEGQLESSATTQVQANFPSEYPSSDQMRTDDTYLQIGRRYIVSNVKSGLLLVDQSAAHQRILYDDLLGTYESDSHNSRVLMFPENISLNQSDSQLMAEISDELNQSGFVISQLGRDMFSVSAVPENIDLKGITVAQLMESVLEDFKSSGTIRGGDFRHTVILSMARKLSVKPGQFMSREMMQMMIARLFASANSEMSPDGRPVYRIISAEELTKMLV
jgi:DNA mismatch repair protein MutL